VSIALFVTGLASAIAALHPLRALALALSVARWEGRIEGFAVGVSVMFAFWLIFGKR
jgi:hypothetical protein